MRKSKTFQCYSYPGHGWLKVEKKYIRNLGIAEKISGFSYMRGNYAYLEEDYDATCLLKKLDELGIKWKLKHNISNKSSKIRSYESFTA